MFYTIGDLSIFALPCILSLSWFNPFNSFAPLLLSAYVFSFYFLPIYVLNYLWLMHFFSLFSSHIFACHDHPVHIFTSIHIPQYLFTCHYLFYICVVFFLCSWIRAYVHLSSYMSLLCFIFLNITISYIIPEAVLLLLLC